MYEFYSYVQYDGTMNNAKDNIFTNSKKHNIKMRPCLNEQRIF